MRLIAIVSRYAENARVVLAKILVVLRISSVRLPTQLCCILKLPTKPSRTRLPQQALEPCRQPRTRSTLQPPVRSLEHPQGQHQKNKHTHTHTKHIVIRVYSFRTPELLENHPKRMTTKFLSRPATPYP